jgi:hypothetical protein
MKLYGRKIIDWSQLDKVPLDKRKALIAGAVSHFMKSISDQPVQPVTGGKIVGHDSNLEGVSPIVLIQSDTLKTPDRGYEVLFDEVDMRASTNDSFEIMDVSGGVTFYQQNPGEEAKLSNLPTTAKTAISFLRFTGGFPILDDWLRFNQYYKIDELTADTVRRWYDKKATLFYGLLTALAADVNESFDTDDVTTINNACAQILEDLADAGYAVDENSQFYITCNPKLRARIYKALAATFINPNTNNNQIVFNIAGIISTTKIANTSYYISLPGGKNKRGEWEDLNARDPQRDELKLGADHVWTGAYNGTIAEIKQHRRCSLS